MINNGASGYIHKNATSQEIIHAIHVASSGKTYLTFDTAITLSAGKHFPGAIGQWFIGWREKEVLALITQGLSLTKLPKNLTSALIQQKLTEKPFYLNLMRGTHPI